MDEVIRDQLSSNFPKELVGALLDCYLQLRSSFFRGDYRPSGLEGGRFAEVVLRILQQVTTGKYTPLGKPLPKFEKIVSALRSQPVDGFHDSIRLHIPRTVQVILDIRNRRDIGHVGGDVDPNRSDAMLVMTGADWILTELLRLFYTSDLSEAQKVVDLLAERRVPLVWERAGELRILNPDLTLEEMILTLLYVRGTEGATPPQLQSWSQYGKGGYFYRMLRKLEERRFIHRAGKKYFITPRGEAWVEKTIDFEVPL